MSIKDRIVSWLLNDKTIAKISYEITQRDSHALKVKNEISSAVDVFFGNNNFGGYNFERRQSFEKKIEDGIIKLSKNILDNTEKTLIALIKKEIHSEAFIDAIIKRIKDKQLS